MTKAELGPLLRDPTVQEIIAVSRLHTRQMEHALAMPWEQGKASVYLEGHYPLHSNEGTFDAYLLRTSPSKDAPDDFRGGEYRVLTNASVHKRRYEGGVKPLFIYDSFPMFLKELADSRVQRALSNARAEVARYPGPAFLIQTKASDIKDGEKRLTPEGQLDLKEEQWYGMLLNVMHMHPGMTISEASGVLGSIGRKPYFQDYGLGIATAMAYFYPGKALPQYESMVLEASDLLQPFHGTRDQETVNFTAVSERIHRAIDPDEQTVEVGGELFFVKNVVSYPVRQNGVVLNIRLIAVQRKGERGFETFRIARYGDQSKAYFRIDSICTNGVQAGDNHCECLEQTRNELHRAEQGTPMCIINMRDHEGRGHGEANKGATLEVQRRLEQELGITLGNGSAAQLFYAGTGKAVDGRAYDLVSAVMKYDGIRRIAHLVTNNEAKVRAMRAVAVVDETVTAEVVEERMSEGAKLTKNDKAAGTLGVEYTY